MQRLRVRFCRGEAIKYISHLDLMRLWERALRRAALPLAYSEGYNPRPRLSLAAPLALGITSESELMDVYFQRWVSPYHFLKAIKSQLPEGIEVAEALAVPPTLPSLQSQVRFAVYEVGVAADMSAEGVEAALSRFLALSELPWQHSRDTGVRRYDLRALVDDLWVTQWQGREGILGMRLRADQQGSGRPEQVAAALGFPQPQFIHRSKLTLGSER